jgi:urocanate hydratase
MNAELAKLKAQNAQITQVGLPAGVDPSMAIAPEAIIANAEESTPNDSHLLRNTLLLVLIVGGFIVAYFWYVGRPNR